MQRREAALACCLIAAIVCMAQAGGFSGSWSMLARLDSFQSSVHLSLDSVLRLDYTLSGQTVGTTVRFLDDEFDFLYLDALGTLGPVDVISIAHFHPSPDLSSGEPYFQWAWASMELDLGGVTFYALPVMSNWIFVVPVDTWGHVQVVKAVPANDVGISLNVGCWGSFGDYSAWTQVSFNNVLSRFGSSNRLIAYQGYDWYVERLLPHPYCDKCGRSSWMGSPPSFPQTPGCALTSWAWLSSQRKRVSIGFRSL